MTLVNFVAKKGTNLATDKTVSMCFIASVSVKLTSEEIKGLLFIDSLELSY